MHADKLIWGFINRFMIWGMCSGWLIGFAIPAIIAVVALSPYQLQESLYDRLTRGGFVLIFGLGTGCIGFVVGGVVGLVNGWLVGSLTKRLFYPVFNPLVYRLLVGMISWVVSLGGGFLFCGIWTLDALIVAAMFAAVASAAGLVASQSIASWYIGMQLRYARTNLLQTENPIADHDQY